MNLVPRTSSLRGTLAPNQLITMKSFLATFIAALCLAGCFKHSPEDSIAFVKDQESLIRGVTFGQVLESKKFCGSKNWSASADDYGRDLVSFDCEIALSKDVTDKLTSDTIAMLEKVAAEKSQDCRTDSKAFVQANAPKVASYYARFATATVRPVFVIYKRQLVDATVLLLDANGQVVKTSDKSKSLLALNFVKSNNPYEADTDVQPVYGALMYSAPSFNFTCFDLKAADQTASAPAPPPVAASEAGFKISTTSSAASGQQEVDSNVGAENGADNR